MRARRAVVKGGRTHRPRDLDARAFGRRALDLGLRIAGARRRVWSGAGAAQLERRFAGPIPEHGRPAARVLDDFVRDIVAHSMPMAHPRLFGIFTPAPLPVAAVGEMLAAFLNQSPDAWKAGPSATEVEKRLVRFFTDRIGWGRGAFGAFTGGGGMANLVALKMARERALGASVRRRGVGRAATRFRVYASDQAHFSIGRGLDLLGLGEDALVRVATGADRRLDPARLDAAIAADRRRGLRPMAIVATAGTTNTGTLDPLPAIAAVARRARTHLHVDAAYGGALLVSTRHRALLSGIERADTVTIDPHKWLFQPFAIGGLFARDAAALRAAFVTEPEYLRKDLEAERGRLDFYHYSMEGSRPFRGLKLWLTLQSLGRAGLGALVDQTMAVTAHLARRVAADPAFEASGAPADLASLCVRYLPSWARGPGRDRGAAAARRLDAVQLRLQQEVERRGFAWFPAIRMRDAVWLRFGVFNPRTTPRDVDRTLAHLKRVARDLGID